MAEQDDKTLVRNSARRLYGDGQPIWNFNDRWNSYKRQRIDQFARLYAATSIQAAASVLDAGCGNLGYDWLAQIAIRLDRFPKQVARLPNAIIGDVETLPFKNEVFDFVVCVASVLNYVSAAEAISEIARVTRHGGGLLLHFETSSSLEYLWRPQWRSLVARIQTVNSGREDEIWIYHPRYIANLLRGAGYKIIRYQGFHIASALGLRFGWSQQRAAALSLLDPIFLPLSRFSDDIILLAERIS
ncbi:MAG TPA: methyltransferase domain-containing protein [Xanthobacteraceae bacterium]|nr:methyltransferase domain-containing protein [Xanthobacteraceae bacterium]